MSSFVGYAYITLLSAGIGFIITLIINFINDLLLKARWSVIHPDTMISVDFLKIMNPVQAMKSGLYSLFLAGWASVFVFLLLMPLPFFQALAGGHIWAAAAIYAFAIYVFMMVILMPIAGRGLFGVLYNPQTPYWSFLLLVLYAVLLGALVSLVL